MAYYKSRSMTSQIQQKEHELNLYLRQGDGNKAKNILGGDDESKFGYMGVVDLAVYDGRGHDAKVVARAQGQQLGVGSPAGTILDCFSLAFTDKRFVFQAPFGCQAICLPFVMLCICLIYACRDIYV
jgi:hypothetical protein